MPEFEFEFNQQDRELVVSQDSGTFSGMDYIRLTIYPIEAINNIVTLPSTGEQAIFYSSLNEEQFDINISPFGAGLDELRLKTIGGNVNDFKIYQNGENIFIKPNDIFDEFELPQGDYRIQVDFLSQVKPSEGHYQFVIKQVSTSRKEIRLKLLDKIIVNNSEDIVNLTNEFNNFESVEITDTNEFLEDETTPNPTFGEQIPNPNYKYQFKHIVNIGNGDHIPIMNYQFDKITDGADNQSLILKLYDALPTNIGNLSMVTIEREVLTTQLQDIFYFSDVPDVFFGDGLIPQLQENWINSDNNDIQFENYDEISGSINEVVLDNLISSSQYNYPNLNTDFKEFSNHTFFGSAKKKLENFKTKVETIQGYYSEISSSLIVSCSVDGDSTFIVQKRKDLFKKINKEFRNFTPYERFLYFDGQSESTSSVPGLGKNYAHTIPVTQQNAQESKTLNNYDGFNVVYKFSDERLDGGTGGITDGHVDLFTNKYKVHEKPFFNYSGSIFLSFLLKGDEAVELRGPLNNQHSQNINLNGEKIFLPRDAYHSTDVKKPSVTGSEYRRFIFKASASYWAPTNVNNDDGIPVNFDIANITNFSGSSTQYEILSGSIKTGSRLIKDSTGKYPTTVYSSSGVSFSGSCMPAGELFRINYQSGSGKSSEATQSLITNVSVTFNDPSDVLPFDNIVRTGSATWTNWYNGIYDSASAFDTNNIHSFENNLPLYLQTDSGSQDMRDFLNLQGEQYDLIRNHIDSMGTIHKRGYKKTNSPPDNTLPMLLSNMGWEAINPFSGSLTDSLGSYLTSVTSIDDIKNNTWRKTLNNLIYLYKSKGTKNSVRALLNTYGYPPDVLEFQEFGGSTEESNPRIFVNEPPTSGIDLSLDRQTGSFGFTSKKEKLYRYMFGSNTDRILNLDWWMDDANLNTIEFVYKHSTTSETQTILKSSGSGTETLWDLRLIPSSDGLSSSFEFRLNNSLTGSLAIASNALSMSTNYSNISDGQLWNVMLQRMTGSTSTNIVNEYRLHASLQDGKDIKTYNYVTMSISGAGATDSNNIANQNFIGSGSRHYLSSSNLFVGEVFSGSLAQIKGWNSALSTSKFRQHTLNKFSIVGNTINSYREELVYHFKLNENYSSASISSSTQNANIVDSAPKTTLTTNYSFEADGNIFNTGSVYGFDLIEVVKLSLQDNISKPNDNGIIINPTRNIVGNLSPIQAAVKPLNVDNSKPLFNTSQKLELYRSPQTFVDNFILDNISGFNLETLYGNPFDYYSSSYGEFDTFKDNFFDAYPIEVDVNKFIRAHESMFNHSIVEGVKSIVPARSTFSDRNSNFGVEIKPTILEKQKYENEKHEVEANPSMRTGSLEVISIESVVSGSTLETAKTGSISVITPETIISSSTLVLPYSSSLERGYIPDGLTTSDTSSLKPSTTGSMLVLPKSGSISTLPSTTGSTVVLSKDGTIDYASDVNKSFVNIHDNWSTSSDATHFLNYAGGTGSYGNYNTYHIDTRYDFIAIGDTEIYSGSRANPSASLKYSDFSNATRFYNREMVSDDIHKNVTYESYITGSPGKQTGRMIGKTRYFATSSDGTITLPRNHVTKFSNPFKDRMIEGTQNINPGILEVRYEDYSTSSFYRVTVTGGENQIKVQTGPSGLSSDNKIIYD